MVTKKNSNSIEGVHLLYQENGHITRVYLEWRHKVLVRFFLVIAGVLFMSRWMFDNPNLHEFYYVPFLLGAIMCFITGLMDNVNGRILGDCYTVGESLENEICNTEGIFKHTNKQYSHPITYTNILRVMYWGSGILFTALGVYMYFNS